MCNGEGGLSLTPNDVANTFAGPQVLPQVLSGYRIERQLGRMKR